MSIFLWCMVVGCFTVALAFIKDISMVNKVAFLGVIAAFVFVFTMVYGGILASTKDQYGREGQDSEGDTG